MKGKIYLKFLIIISLALSLIGATYSINEEITVTTEEIKAITLEYSKDLSAGKITDDLNYSPMMRKLLQDRRDFYKEFFDIGLNSDLLSIESDFKVESITKDDKHNNVYKVKAIETVTMNGKYRCTSPEDYPLVKAGRLALSKTENPTVKVEIESYIKRMIDSISKSIKEDSFQIVFIVEHDLIIRSNKNEPIIIQDTFTDKANDNPEGHDNINWVNGKFIRKKQDLNQMPDYIIYHTPIEKLSEDLLRDYEKITLLSYPPQYHYYHSSATYYINTYTSNNDNSCSTVRADHSRWNCSSYSSSCNSGSNLYCADCADYVSQALKYGGCTTNSIWKPYTYAWVNVSGLKDHFISDGRGYWVSSLSSLQAGDIAFIPWSHVVMVSATGPHRYSAHTNDRLKYSWSSSINKYMKIVVEPPGG